MWELDCEESWALENWCFWAVVLEKTLESPLDCKEIQPVHSEGDRPWDSFGRDLLKLKLQYSGHLMQRIDSLEKTLMLGGTGGKRRRGRQRMRWLDGITRLDGRVFEWTPGVGDGQAGLACCDSWGCKESGTTEWLNWTKCWWSAVPVVGYSITWISCPLSYDVIIMVFCIKIPHCGILHENS